MVDDLESLSLRPYRFAITNEDRAVGAHFSGEVLRRIRPSFGLSAPDIPGVDCEFVGTAGQSFGAFLISGANFHLIGEANDYVGKGLCGGSIAISTHDDASERGDVLVGNTVLYGATAGELFIAGRAGERFAVRNSGALAVVEGVGRHGCEYMTAGIVLILGPAGDNLGAGMTGGLTYLLREDAQFSYRSIRDVANLDFTRLDLGRRDLARPDFARLDFANLDQASRMNRDSVRFAALQLQEEQWLRRILHRHVQLTGSPRAAELLSRPSLPLLRVEPITPPCSVEDTWSPILSLLAAAEERTYERDQPAASERPSVH